MVGAKSEESGRTSKRRVADNRPVDPDLTVAPPPPRPLADAIGTQIDMEWCSYTNRYNYEWKKDVVSAKITFKKTVELVGVDCPPGKQISYVEVNVKRGETLHWCAQRFKPGHCIRYLNYEFQKAVETIIITTEGPALSGIETRARDAYRKSANKPAAKLGASLPYFEVSARRLSATDPVMFTGEMGNVLAMEVNNTESPTRSVATFPIEQGHLGFRLFDLEGWRFYGECLIAIEGAPEGSVFQPVLREMKGAEVTKEIKMTWNAKERRWCFVTSAAQLAETPLVIAATGTQMPVDATWTFKGLRLLPFRLL